MQSTCNQHAISIQSTYNQLAISMQSACNQLAISMQSACLRRELHLQLHHLLIDVVFMHHLRLRRAVTGTVLDAGSRRAGIPPDEGGNQPDEGGHSA